MCLFNQSVILLVLQWQQFQIFGDYPFYNCTILRLIRKSTMVYLLLNGNKGENFCGMAHRSSSSNYLQLPFTEQNQLYDGAKRRSSDGMSTKQNRAKTQIIPSKSMMNYAMLILTSTFVKQEIFSTAEPDCLWEKPFTHKLDWELYPFFHNAEQCIITTFWTWDPAAKSSTVKTYRKMCTRFQHGIF